MAASSRYVSDSELERQHSVLLVALYLRGLSRIAEPKRSAWPVVLSKIRLECADFGSASTVLKRHGYDLEGLLVDDCKLLDTSENLLARSRALTPLDSVYPSRWLDRLGALAPPAIWWNGRVWHDGPSVTVVGSRQINRDVETWAQTIGSKAAEAGWLVVSGAAAGCDKAAIQGALKFRGVSPSGAISILPCGINQISARKSAILSICEPNAPFSPAQAMERNTLLYASSEWAIVAHSRFREGGTWAGCTDAMRRRLCRVAVSRESNELSVAALSALGAQKIDDWDEFEQLRKQSEAGVLPMSYRNTQTIDGQFENVKEYCSSYMTSKVA